MAFILGIYEELLESIRKFSSPESIRMIVTLQWKKAYRELPWPFLLALAVGILTAIFSLASAIKWMLENQSELIWSFFFGLVLASIFTVLKKVGKWNTGAVISILAGAAAAWAIVGMVPSQTTDAAWFILLCGAIAICAMILPGISGSFILVLLGKYDYILGAVHNLRIAVKTLDFNALFSNSLILALFMVGIVIGLSSFVRLLEWLFKRWHDWTVCALIGFMAGSLRKVWPFKANDVNIMPEEFSRQVLFALILGIVGFALVVVLERLAVRRENRLAPNASPVQEEKN